MSQVVHQSRAARRSVAALITACALSFSLAQPLFATGAETDPAPAPPAAPASAPILVEAGHLDIFNVFAPAGEGLALNIRDGRTAPAVERAPATVVLGVNDSRRVSAPAQAGTNRGLPEQFYELPASQVDNSLWPGWETTALGSAGFSNVTLDILGMQIPTGAKLEISMPGNLGAPERSLTDAPDAQDYELRPGRAIRVEILGHAHMRWVFTTPGVYRLAVRAAGDRGEERVFSDPHIYTWYVGYPAPTATTTLAARQAAIAPFDRVLAALPPLQVAAVDARAHALSRSQVQPLQVAEPNYFVDQDLQAAPAPADDTNPAQGAAQGTAQGAAQGTAQGAGGQAGKGGTAAGTGDALTTQVLPDEAGGTDPAGGAGAGATQVTDGVQTPTDGAAAVAGVPGADAPVAGVPGAGAGAGADGAQEQCIPTTITRELKPGEVPQAGPGQGAAAGSVTIPANTHVHPNWVFSAPGRYKLSVRLSAKAKSGQTLSTSTTLNFNVGGAGNANSGHFDFGAQVVDGKLVAAVKDDRTQPAQWRQPEQLVFGLGGAAHVAQAPAGIEFVAAAGSPIWMIGSAQVANVPWLGANSMHETLLSQTTGALTLTLTGVDGPGKVAVFTSGGIGQAVGARWFGSTGSTTPAVTTVNDKRMVTEVVGRTSTGQPCQLPSGAGTGALALTGAYTLTLVSLALSLSLVGFALGLWRRSLKLGQRWE